ncbi:MAG: ferritin family protein [Candidatus Omnitrophota bacterium]
MENIFNPQEILKVAINVEKNGKKLYESLEGKAKDSKVGSMWKHLKEQEEAHCKVFEGMLDTIGDYIVDEFNPGEYDAYLRAIASEYVFTQDLIEKKTKEGFITDLAAVDFGINIEKTSIITYSALREYVLTVNQAVLDKVIAEERKHLVKLVELKRQIV